MLMLYVQRLLWYLKNKLLGDKNFHSTSILDEKLM